MLNHRSRIARHAIAPAALLAALALAPASMARVHVDIGVNIALPPHVQVSVPNYDSYYVGRVFYQPLGVWRPVYSFPVETPYGIAYSPYVYDESRVACRDFIPGHEVGYGQFVIEGRSRYNPHWDHGKPHGGKHGHGGKHSHGGGHHHR